MKTHGFDYYTTENIHPGFSIDCVLLSAQKGKINVLLRKFGLKDYWALPGGFVFNDENADQAASRIVESCTGVKEMFLQQFHLFSNPDRVIMEQNIDFRHLHARSDDEGRWLLNRFITMGYYALMRYDQIEFPPDLKDALKWHGIHRLPRMYSDHEHIILTALEMISAMLPIIPLGYKLLPEKFTMTELRRIYETALQKKLDRRNFHRKMMSGGCLEQLPETKPGISHKPPILYRFTSPDVGFGF